MLQNLGDINCMMYRYKILLFFRVLVHPNSSTIEEWLVLPHVLPMLALVSSGYSRLTGDFEMSLDYEYTLSVNSL